MGFTLYNLFKSGLLVTNGVAVLHRKRFLRNCAYRPFVSRIRFGFGPEQGRRV